MLIDTYLAWGTRSYGFWVEDWVEGEEDWVGQDTEGVGGSLKEYL